MTTPKPRVVSSRRDQLVTALLVGTVVVVLGFASGIGVDTRTAGASGGGPQLSTVPSTPAPSTSSRPPVNYVAVPAPPQPTVVAPVVAAPISSATTSSEPAAAPTIAPTTAAPAPTTAAPVPAGPPTCGSDLLTGLLHALVDPAAGLLGLVDSILGSTPLAGGAVSSGPLDLSSLFGVLGGATKQPAQPTSLLSLVTGLLPKVLPTLGAHAPSPSAALASSCTNALSPTLPLLAGLG